MSAPERISRFPTTRKMRNCIEQLADRLSARRVLVAYSGGVDSAVLLHAALHSQLKGKIDITAVHVHHGLNLAADEWAQFCENMAGRWGAAFRVLRVDAAPRGRRSPEEAARRARYTALKELMRGGDVLMTAHQRDDQAETVLLQLLRGSGPAGLAGMPGCMSFGSGHLARPLLDVTREEIERYAREQRLEWIEDPMNDEPRLDRNYLRRQLAPVLRKRWPGWRETLARVARHQGEAHELILQVARERYARCRDDDDTLSVKRCLALPAVERKAVVRYWIEQCKLPTPSERQLRNLIAAVLSDDARSGAQAHWPGGEIRHYRGRLYATAPAAPTVASQTHGNGEQRPEMVY